MERRNITIKIMKQEISKKKEEYQNTAPGRRNLIEADIISDAEYARQWQDIGYNGKDFLDDENEIVTERGERVRSKSEKIIADKLYALGIPYRYEYPLELAGNVRIYPDFTILKLPEREEVYLEHFGMMDDADCVDNVLYKLNTRALDGMLRKLFCEE